MARLEERRMRWDESVRASRTLGRPPHAQHAIAAISEGEAWWTIMAYGNNTVQFLIA